MKNFLSLLVLILPIFVILSCNRDIETPILELTEEELIEIIEASFQQNSGGPLANVLSAAEQIETNSTSGGICDSVYTKVISNNYQGIRINSNYSSEFTHEMTCNNFNIPATAAFSVTTSSTFSTRRLDADGSSTFSGSVTGLQPLSSSLNFSASFNRSGSQELNIRSKKSISSDFSLEFTNIEISKQTLLIQSGSAIFSFTGLIQNTPFAYTGSLIFDGNQGATLTVGSTTVSINWI